MRSLKVVGFLALSLLADGASAAPLQEAAKAGDVTVMRRLIDEGANLDARAGFGTALHWALLNGHDEAVALLVARGADVNVKTAALGAPLHSAAAAGDASMVLLLLEHGADANARRSDGYTPLHVAAERGDAAIVRALLDHGADANAIAQDEASAALGRQTPLHVAIAGRHAEVASLLRSAGAAPPPIEPITTLMASASAERGRDMIVHFRCTMCHAFERDDPRRLDGPTLWGVVGRPAASQPGFAYSAALQALGGTWSEERLYAFISHPFAMAPGTKMDMEARGEPQQRADLIAYLRTLADAVPQ